ncbi:MAG TPA: sulfite exporter TauE/SafE family protein, partial [Candidatus Dormibacteraeota bacterium]|nr:sulfite exporter TauE/SafE family protein [Candidatus Dormibacteraeota bacterium]
MHVDILLAVAGLLVGMLVGITGAGGGSLLTPVLVVLFGLPPAAAVSSDIVVSMVTRPLGAAIHLRRRTVHKGIVLWLAIGSVPAGFAGAVLDHLVGAGAAVQQALQTGIAVMLLIAAAGLGFRTLVMRRRQVVDLHPRQIAARPLPTLLLGAAGGLVFGMTSVGAGSLMMVSLLALYPSLPA